MLAWLLFLPKWPHLAAVVSRAGDIFLFEKVQGLPNIGGQTAMASLLVVRLLLAAAVLFAAKSQGEPLRPGSCWILAAGITIVFGGLTLITPIPRLYSVKRITATG